MHPHMFAGAHGDEDGFDNDDDEMFDLSGWMSRSPPEGGLGNMHYEEPPMVEEPTIRERVRTRARSNAQASSQFTPPMPNPYQGIAGTPKFISAESPFNPLWVADDSFFPKATQVLKISGFGGLVVGTTLYGAGRLAHGRASKQTQDMLEFNSPYAAKLALAGLFGYLHPVLGAGKGIMPFDGWKFKTLTLGTHALGLFALTYLIKRV